MSMKAALATILVFSIAVSLGCAKPGLTRRYAALEPGQPVGTGAVQLTASAFPIDPPSQKSIFDLGSEGQAALITAIASQTGSTPLHAALAAPISRNPSPGVVDRTSVSRRIVLSVSADHAGLADRLDYSDIMLTLAPASPAKFASWNQLATKHETVDLGKLTFTQKDALSFGLEGVLPGISEITKATVGGARDRTLGEEVQLRQRYVVTTGALTPAVARVIQQGAVGIDLVGNAVLDITLTAKKVEQDRLYTIDGLFKNNKPQLPADVMLGRRLVRYAAALVSDWTADISADFRRRKVAEGDMTVTESDDRVSYEPIKQTTSLTLVSAEDLKVSKWLLLAPDGRPVHVQENTGVVPLQFDSFEGAMETLRWLLETNADTIAGRAIGFFVTNTRVAAPPGQPRWIGLRVEINGVNWTVP